MLNISSMEYLKAVYGPLLLNIMVNDIFDIKISGPLFLYADDMTLVYSENNLDQIEIKANDDLENIKNWLNENRLVLNPDKSKYILIGSEVVLNIKYKKYIRTKNW